MTKASTLACQSHTARIIASMPSDANSVRPRTVITFLPRGTFGARPQFPLQLTEHRLGVRHMPQDHPLIREQILVAFTVLAALARHHRRIHPHPAKPAAGRR